MIFHNYKQNVLVEERFSFLFLRYKQVILDVIRYIFHLYPNKVNIQNGEYRTPLHLAASLGDIAMCEVLIQCGARVNSFIQTSGVSYYIK